MGIQEVTESTRVKSGPCQSCHLLHWPKGPDPNPIHHRGGEGEMETARERAVVIDRKDKKKEYLLYEETGKVKINSY